jgi:thiol-disulfide isomerase/thioredoxin
VVAFAFSGLTACTDSVSSEKGNVENTVSNGGNPVKRSDYPPIASAVANADLKNLDGSTFKVADRKGKVLVLNLWATWCGPCRQEMPTLVRMQETHGKDQLEIIGLNTDDESVELINEFAANMKLNYTLVWADTATQAALLKISQFGGIPQSFVIDRDGNLRGVFRGAGPADVRKMEELVAKVVRGDDTAVEVPAANTSLEKEGDLPLANENDSGVKDEPAKADKTSKPK